LTVIILKKKIEEEGEAENENFANLICG